jgi:hypothetical protein
VTFCRRRFLGFYLGTHEIPNQTSEHSFSARCIIFYVVFARAATVWDPRVPAPTA